MESKGKGLKRDEYIYLTKLFLKVNRHEEIIKWVKGFVELDPILSLQERNLCTSAFKNMVGSKRSMWRTVRNTEKKAIKAENENNLRSARDLRHRIEKELRQSIAQVDDLLENHLIPNAKEAEDQVYYLKLKGDYHRYAAEFHGGEDRENSIELAEQCYNLAYQISEENIPIGSSTRLGLALNFSVFFWEIKEMKEEAMLVAQNAFDQAIEILEELEKQKAKESILIIQLLKENLTMWNNQVMGEMQDLENIENLEEEEMN